MTTTSRLLHPKIGHSHWSNVVLFFELEEVTVCLLGSSSLCRTRSSEFVSVGLISLQLFGDAISPFPDKLTTRMAI